LKGLSLSSFKEPIKSQKKPRKINEKEKEGKEGAGAGGRNATCEKIKSGAVSFFGAGVSPDQKNKIKLQALYSPEFFLKICGQLEAHSGTSQGEVYLGYAH
jgi:hypothetical protein